MNQTRVNQMTTIVILSKGLTKKKKKKEGKKGNQKEWKS